VVADPALGEMAGVMKSGGDRSLDKAAAAWRSGRPVSLLALSQSGEGERERMGARLGVWKRKKGAWQPARRAAGGGRRCRAGARRGRGGPDQKTGEEEKPMTGGAWLLCWRFKSNRTDPKQFK
jgi:hypothetical protein